MGDFCSGKEQKRGGGGGIIDAEYIETRDGFAGSGCPAAHLMARLIDLVPDTDTLLALPTEELAGYVFGVARRELQTRPDKMCHIQMIVGPLGVPLGGQGAGYNQSRLGEVERAVTEAWTWLEREGYVIPAPDINGRNGWRVPGRKAVELKDPKTIRAAAKFPKELLHPTMAERAWMSIMRGDFDTAVTQAYIAVEQAVRSVGGFADKDFGGALMRKAFDPEIGPLKRPDAAEERARSIAQSIIGAFGSHRNPYSHGTVTAKDDASEAQHLVMLASHLMRIVDTRGPSRP